MSNIKIKPTAQQKRLRERLNESNLASWRLLLLTTEAVYSHLEKNLAKKGVTYPRFRLLFALYFDAPLSATQMAARLGVSRGNMSSFVKRLEEDGLIIACPFISTKGRPKFYLTPKGTKSAERLMNFHFDHIKKLPLKLGQTTMQELQSLKTALESKIHD